MDAHTPAASGAAPAGSVTPPSRLSAIFSLDRSKLHPLRGVAVVPLVVLAAIPQEKYWISVAFGGMFVWLSDPGGPFRSRLRRLAEFAVIGALLTALGYEIGTAAWGWVVVAAFAITLISGLSVKLGLHSFTAAVLLNVWFLIAISQSVAVQNSQVDTTAGAQTLAWLLGSVVAIVCIAIIWFANGRGEQDRPWPDIVPGDTPAVPLTRPMILFAVIRALAVAIAVAIAWGLDVPNADWMPIAALVAMRGSLAQSKLTAAQRLAGATIGAIVAAVFLSTIQNTKALVVIIVLLGALAAMTRAASYTWYCAAVAAVVLIAMDLPDPANLSDEGRRILFTFVGVGIAVLVTFLATQLAKRSAPAPQPKPAG